MIKENKTSVKRNFIYNILYQLLILVIPLITAPYLSRVVGADGVGTYSYTYSIVYYFMMFTLLGVNNYGNRMIAKVRDDKEKLSKTFFSIYMIQLILGIVMLILYFIYISFFEIKYKNIALIESLFIISSILDINWFFFGMEEFKKTITRNTIVKISTVILIFIFVKSSGDLWKYILIMSAMTCISQILLWSFLIGKINFKKINFNDVKIHIKADLILFIPVIAISLYKIMDKIMLGNLSNIHEVGYYENAEKIINVPLTLITALGTVMLPRISNIISKGKDGEVIEYIQKSTKFIFFISLPMCFGLIAIGKNFAPLFFGKSFNKTGVLIQLLAITIPFISFANVIRTQYLIPKEKDSVFVISVILGAILNFIMNSIFIPKYKSIGACFGTIAAEFIVMFYQVYKIRKELKIFKYMKTSIKFIIRSIIMFIIIYLLNYININSFIRIIFQIIFGVFIYFILNIKYINEVLNLKNMFIKIKERL